MVVFNSEKRVTEQKKCEKNYHLYTKGRCFNWTIQLPKVIVYKVHPELSSNKSHLVNHKLCTISLLPLTLQFCHRSIMNLCVSSHVIRSSEQNKHCPQIVPTRKRAANKIAAWRLFDEIWYMQQLE